jgi:hypothetical protein
MFKKAENDQWMLSNFSKLFHYRPGYAVRAAGG